MLLQALLEKGVTMFPNLTSLVLEDFHFGANLRPLWCFLRMAPALNRLALDSCEVRPNCATIKKTSVSSSFASTFAFLHELLAGYSQYIRMGKKNNKCIVVDVKVGVIS